MSGESIWGSIRDLDHINVRLADLPDECGHGVLVRQPDGQVWILLGQHLPQRDRRAILAHELEHLRRGSVRFEGAPPAWDAVVAKEERQVDQVVADRLVPLEELRAFVEQRGSLEEPVTVDCVAEAFDVPDWVARHACMRAV